MAKPNEKLAESLVRLRNLQEGGRMVVRSNELTRVHRERLIKSGYLREAIKGWLISSSPDSDPGDTTPWFASFWEFCAAYCTSRFGKDWRLSPEQSLLLHAENAAIPKQVVVHALKGANNRINLPLGTSLYDLQQKDMPPNSDLAERGGLRLFAPNAALVRVQASFFILYPVEASVALSGVRDASEVLASLLGNCRRLVAQSLRGDERRLQSFRARFDAGDCGLDPENCARGNFIERARAFAGNRFLEAMGRCSANAVSSKSGGMSVPEFGSRSRAGSPSRPLSKVSQEQAARPIDEGIP